MDPSLEILEQKSIIDISKIHVKKKIAIFFIVDLSITSYTRGFRFFLIASVVTLSACRTSNNSERTELDYSNPKGFFKNKAEMILNDTDIKLKESGVTLNGIISDSKNDHMKADIEGYPCTIRLYTKENAIWKNQKPAFKVFLKKPSLELKSTEESPFDYAWNEGKEEIYYGGSLDPKLKLIETGNIKTIRSFTKSGLFITAATGYSDLLLTKDGKIISAEFYDYDYKTKKSIITGACRIEKGER